VTGGLPAFFAVAQAWADHGGGGRRAEGWSPMLTSLVFGGLTLVAGVVVIAIVAALNRRDHR
jgi:ABC-type Fe3+ transport system permease subunit